MKDDAKQLEIIYPTCCDETSNPRRKVNNKATRIINEAHLEQPSIGAPYTEGTNGVRERNP